MYWFFGVFLKDCFYPGDVEVVVVDVAGCSISCVVAMVICTSQLLRLDRLFTQA